MSHTSFVKILFLFKNACLVVTKIKNILKIEKWQICLNILHAKRNSRRELGYLYNGNDCMHIALLYCCNLKYHQ